MLASGSEFSRLSDPLSLIFLLWWNLPLGHFPDIFKRDIVRTHRKGSLWPHYNWDSAQWELTERCLMLWISSPIQQKANIFGGLSPQWVSRTLVGSHCLKLLCMERKGTAGREERQGSFVDWQMDSNLENTEIQFLKDDLWRTYVMSNIFIFKAL